MAITTPILNSSTSDDLIQADVLRSEAETRCDPGRSLLQWAGGCVRSRAALSAPAVEDALAGARLGRMLGDLQPQSASG